MINLFKQKNPGNALILLLYALVLKFPVFIHPSLPVTRPQDGFLYRTLVEWFTRQPGGAVMCSFLAFLLLFTQASHLNKIINDQRLFARPNFLTGMSYLLITSFFPEWNQFSAGLLVNSLLIWALVKMMALYNTHSPKTQLFNMGILVGLASFLFFPAVAFVLLVFFALLLMRPFRFSEWVITIMGLLAPYYFLFIILFLSGNWEPGPYLPYISIEMLRFRPSIWAAAAISLMVIPFLAGGYYVQANLGKMLIQTRKCWSLLLLYTLVSPLIPFINTSQDFGNWILCTVPFAAFHAAAYFYPRSGLVPGIVHWLAFAMAIYLNYFGS